MLKYLANARPFQKGIIPYCFHLNKTTHRDGYLNIQRIDIVSQQIEPRNAFSGFVPYSYSSIAIENLEKILSSRNKLTLQIVQNALKEIEKGGSTSMSSEHALFLIKCCGNTMRRESSKRRTTFLNELINWLEQRQQLDIKHYNAILGVYLENDHEFEVSEFVENLRQKQLEPNEETNKKLIEYHCLRGDINQVQKILENLAPDAKQSMIPNSPLDILYLMSSINLQPDADTVTVIIRHHIKKKELDSMANIINRHRSEFTDVHYFQIIKELSINNHIDELDAQLDAVNESENYNKTITDMIIFLSQSGHNEAALKLSKSIKPFSNAERRTSSYFFTSEFVKVANSIESIVHICMEIDRINGCNLSLTAAFEWAIQFKKIDLAYAILKQMHAQDSMKTKYLHSILSLETQGGVESLRKAVSIIQNELGFEIDPDTVGNFILSNLQTSSHNADELMSILKKVGISQNASCDSIILFCIRSGELSTAHRIAKQSGCNISWDDSVRIALIDALFMSDNIDQWIEFLRYFLETRLGWPKYVMGDIVYDMFERLKDNANRDSILVNYLQRLCNERFVINDSKFSKILNDFESSSSDEVLNLVRKLSDPVLENVNSSVKAITKPTIEENTLSMSTKPDNELHKWLSGKMAMKDKDATELIESLARQNDSERALGLYELKKTNANDFKLNDVAVILLAYSLVRVNRFADAQKIFLENIAEGTRNTNISKEINLVSSRILDHLNRTSQLDQLDWFVDELLERNYINKMGVGDVMRIYLKDHVNVNKALELFYRFSNKYQITPWLNVLMCKLIEAEDVEHLERILTISANLHGEKNSLYGIAFALTECNRIAQAQKMFEKIGISGEEEDFPIMDGAIHNFSLRRKTKALHNLLKATKGCVSTQYRIKMFEELLLLYATDAVTQEEVTNLYTTMKSENIMPSEQKMAKIIAVFRRKRLTVPNEWLCVGAIADNDDQDSDNKLKALIDVGDLGEAKMILFKRLEQENPFERQTLRYLFRKCADHSDLDLFNDLRSKFNEETKNMLKFPKYDCLAHIKSGKCLEYIHMLREQVAKGNINKTTIICFPDNFVQILDEHSHLYAECEEMAKEYAARGFLKPICILWAHNFANNKNSAENEKIWKKYLLLRQTVICKQATAYLFRNKQYDRLLDFMNLAALKKQYIQKNELGRSYSMLFDGLFFSNNYDQIIAEWEKAIEFISLRDLKPNTLDRIKRGPEDLSNKFWVIFNKAKEHRVIRRPSKINKN